MTRLTLALLGLSLILPNAAIAQVRITVPAQQYKAHEEIHAKVKNTGKGAVTLCVEFGQTSSKGGEIESTPSPFWVQRNDKGKWGTLMIGPDVGSNRGAVVLEAGEFKEFPFRLSDSGKMRLRLSYWKGSMPDLDCHVVRKGSHPVRSGNFTIR
jgi:hypothetical protein